MPALFDSVRGACSPQTWSRGVELARRGAVALERDEGGELVLRVASGRLSLRVHLDPARAWWECECAGAEDPCDHVAAAAIAWRRASESGGALPRSSEAGARIGYRFARQGSSLAFGRAIVGPAAGPGGEVPVAGSLAALASGRMPGPGFAATPADWRIEELLDTRVGGVLPRELWPRLLAALGDCPDVRLDGQPVAVSSEPVLPLVQVEDRGDGFVAALLPDPALREAFANGVGLCDGTLRPLADPRLSLREREELGRGRYFKPDDAGRLVSELLPALEGRVRIDVRSARLPRAASVPPRLEIDARREADALRVRAALVYGDPTCARIEEGRLVHLEGVLPLRDRPAEERLLRRLRQELGLEPGREFVYAPREAIAFAERLSRFSEASPGAVRGRDHQQFVLLPELSPRLRLGGEGSSFELDFGTHETSGGTPRRALAAAVLRAWQAGQSLVPLEGGGFAPLPADWLERHGRTLADLLAARDARGELPACALPDLARLCQALGAPPPPGFERLRGLVGEASFAGLPEARLPDDLTAELRHYQELGVRWLAFLRDAGLGALLADDMGLGKTLQALCALRGRALVVCPTSVLFGWAEQIRRFRPRLRCAVYHGPRRALDASADVTLTSYALLRSDVDALAARVWDTLILDEAQAIKNSDSQVARAAFALRAGFRMTLTGTPVENRLDELWSQMHFLNPGLLGSLADFRTRYARPIAEGAEGAAAYLRERIRPFVLRRLKSEVAPELPPRTESVLHCELAEPERAVYDAVRAATRREVVERLREGGSVLEALEALLRLRQAACHTALLPGQSAESSAKLEVLLESLEEAVAEGHKSLVFSQWTSLLDLVEPHLRQAAIAFTRLDGSTRDREGVVARFQDAAGPPVLLISLRAGGTGLNLTAADHVFLLDPWWNPAVEAQAADRAHRIGQERPVSIYRLVARDTVEERILELQERKRALADAALAGADRAASLTRDDLLALLE